MLGGLPNGVILTLKWGKASEETTGAKSGKPADIERTIAFSEKGEITVAGQRAIQQIVEQHIGQVKEAKLAGEVFTVRARPSDVAGSLIASELRATSDVSEIGLAAYKRALTSQLTSIAKAGYDAGKGNQHVLENRSAAGVIASNVFRGPWAPAPAANATAGLH